MIATGLIVLLIVFPGAIAAMLTAHRLLRLRRVLINVCPRCLHPLRDLVGGRCAECGQTIPDVRDLGGVRNVSDALPGREMVFAVGTAMALTSLLVGLRSVGYSALTVTLGLTLMYTLIPVLGTICLPMPKALARRLVWRIWGAFVVGSVGTFAVTYAAGVSDEDACILILLVSASAALWTFCIVGSGIRHAVMGGRRPIAR